MTITIIMITIIMVIIITSIIKYYIMAAEFIHGNKIFVLDLMILMD